jgi:hypothetical protein
VLDYIVGCYDPSLLNQRLLPSLNHYKSPRAAMNAPTTPAAAGTATTPAAAVLEADIAAFEALACSLKLLILAATSLVTAGAEAVTSAIWLDRLSMTVARELADALSV